MLHPSLHLKITVCVCVTLICLPSTTRPPAASLLLLRPWRCCCCCPLPPRPRRAAGASPALEEELEERKDIVNSESEFKLCGNSASYGRINTKTIRAENLLHSFPNVLHMQITNTRAALCGGSGALADRLVINHVGKQWQDRHSPYIITVIILCLRNHTHT